MYIILYQYDASILILPHIGTLTHESVHFEHGLVSKWEFAKRSAERPRDEQISLGQFLISCRQGLIIKVHLNITM